MPKIQRKKEHISHRNLDVAGITLDGSKGGLVFVDSFGGATSTNSQDIYTNYGQIQAKQRMGDCCPD